MKQRNIPPPGAPMGRRTAGRAQDDHIIDTYKSTRKLEGPARCPRCGAVYNAGRWQWTERPPEDAHEELCTACHRINDNYPAGIVTLKGPIVNQHKGEILNLIRKQEEAEKGEHPLNRIMAIEEAADDTLVITTTDIHLPRRIGEAVARAFARPVHALQRRIDCRQNRRQILTASEAPCPRARSSRNHGRDEIGIVGDYKSESVGDFIGIRRAFHGDLKLNYDEGYYFVRVDWERAD